MIYQSRRSQMLPVMDPIVRQRYVFIVFFIVLRNSFFQLPPYRRKHFRISLGELIDQEANNGSRNPLTETVADLTPQKCHTLNGRARRQHSINDQNVPNFESALKHRPLHWNYWNSSFIPNDNVSFFVIFT